MRRQSIARVIVAAVAITMAGIVGAGAGPQAKGRYKKDGANCVWVANDSGPNQCTPLTRGRFKKSGSACVWVSRDSGEDQCRPAQGRFKKSGDSCVWSAKDSGPDQCNPRQPR